MEALRRQSGTKTLLDQIEERLPLYLRLILPFMQCWKKAMNEKRMNHIFINQIL